MWPLLLAGGALGAAKTGYDSIQQGKERKVQAATTRWSPWTGMKAAEPRKLDLLGDIMKGGLSAAMIGNMMPAGGAAATAPAAAASAPMPDFSSPWDKLYLMSPDDMDLGYYR